MAALKRIASWIGDFLSSRKVRVALATVIAAAVAKAGLHVSEDMVLTILGVGTALIMAIAHEDHGMKTGITPEQWAEFVGKEPPKKPEA